MIVLSNIKSKVGGVDDDEEESSSIMGDRTVEENVRAPAAQGKKSAAPNDSRRFFRKGNARSATMSSRSNHAGGEPLEGAPSRAFPGAHPQSEAQVQAMLLEGQASSNNNNKFSDLTCDSTHHHCSPPPPRFGLMEVVSGKTLGVGGFSTVLEIRSFDLADDRPLARHSRHGGEQQQLEQDEGQCRHDLADHCLQGSHALYAMKRLSPQVIQDPVRYKHGMLDLAMEARILSSMGEQHQQHPNIVRLCGISEARPHEGQYYFLILDRLYDTLEERMQVWVHRLEPPARCRGFWRKRPSLQVYYKLLTERLQVASDVSAALHFLHDRRIIHRDVKPENIGFDINNVVKLFDFGLSRKLPSSGDAEDADQRYKMTGMIGSPRYMAPEVGLGRPYNETCDVYSFGIILWELMSLKRPFDAESMTSLRVRAWEEPYRRPPLTDLPDLLSANIRALVCQCWSPHPTDRRTPGLARAREILAAEMEGLPSAPHKRRPPTTAAVLLRRGYSSNNNNVRQS